MLSLFHHKYLYLAVVQGHAAYKGEEFKLQKLLPLWPPIYGDPLPSRSDTRHAMPDMPDGTLSLNGVLGRCPSLKRMTLSSITTLKELALVHVATQSQLHSWQACISHICNRQLTHGSSIKKVSISGFYTQFLMKKQWCLCQKCTSQQYNVRDQCLVALSQLWLYVDSTYQFCAWLGTWYTTSTPGSAQGSKNMECPGCLPETLR